MFSSFRLHVILFLFGGIMKVKLDKGGEREKKLKDMVIDIAILSVVLIAILIFVT